jgi:hypothetical protein
LASLVAVVPICAWLVDLHAGQLQSSFERQTSLTVKLYVNELPGMIAHCVTATGPSMCVVPFWYRPWKCSDVLSFPSEFLTLTTTRSPLVATIGSIGHLPLMPITGRVCWPSGFAYVHAISVQEVNTYLISLARLAIRTKVISDGCTMRYRGQQRYWQEKARHRDGHVGE